MNKSDAIRAYCRVCFGEGGLAHECELVACPLYRYRLGSEDKRARAGRLNRSQAVHAFCVKTCMCGSARDVTQCSVVECLLHPYRR